MQKALTEIRERITRSAILSGRKADAVKLLAVSKTFPVSALEEAYNLGERSFGESRTTELIQKAQTLTYSDLEWHFIGAVQSNKVNILAQYAHWVHSMEHERGILRLNRACGERARQVRILLEANVSGEESKSGIRDFEELKRLTALAFEQPNLLLQGFMTMAPLTANEAELHRVFSRLRETRDKLEADLGVKLPELSMGMSGDFEIAIAEGATIVRIGTAIFGGR